MTEQSLRARLLARRNKKSATPLHVGIVQTERDARKGWRISGRRASDEPTHQSADPVPPSLAALLEARRVRNRLVEALEIRRDLCGENLPTPMVLSPQRTQLVPTIHGSRKRPAKAWGWALAQGGSGTWACIDDEAVEAEPPWFLKAANKRYPKHHLPVAANALDLVVLAASSMTGAMYDPELDPSAAWRAVVALEKDHPGLEAETRAALGRLAALAERDELARYDWKSTLGIIESLLGASAEAEESVPEATGDGEPIAALAIRWPEPPKSVDPAKVKVAPHDKYVLLLPKSGHLDVAGAGVALVHTKKPPHLLAKVLPKRDEVVARAWHPTKGRLQPLELVALEDRGALEDSRLGGHAAEGAAVTVRFDLFGGALGSGSDLTLRIAKDRKTVDVEIPDDWRPAIDADDPSTHPVAKAIEKGRQMAPQRDPAHRPDARFDLPQSPPPVSDGVPRVPALALRWSGAPPAYEAAGKGPGRTPLLVLPKQGELLPVSIAVLTDYREPSGHRIEVLPEGLEVPPLAWSCAERRLVPIELVPFDDVDEHEHAVDDAHVPFARPARIGGCPRWLQADESTKVYRYVAHISVDFLQWETGEPYDLYLLLHRDNHRGRVVMQCT